jgi:hypothetical protein
MCAPQFWHCRAHVPPAVCRLGDRVWRDWLQQMDCCSLGPQEFKACLSSDMAAGLKLSRQDINTLLTEVDADGDGLVDYEVRWCGHLLCNM